MGLKHWGQESQTNLPPFPTGPMQPARLQDASQQKPVSFKHVENRQFNFKKLKRAEFKKVPQNFTVQA